MARKPAVIRPREQFEESLREALLAEIDAALSECDRLSSWDQSERREAVHELRRALKRFRAGASLCKGAVDAVEVRAVQEEVRATAERLSATRDRDVLVESIGRAVKVFPPSARRSAQAIAVAVLAPEKATTSTEDWATAGAIIRGQLEAMRFRMQSVDLRAVSPDGVAAVIAQRWRRARKAALIRWRPGELDALHDVRKACQRIALQLQLVSRLGPRRKLERLASGLGRVVSNIGADRDLGLLERLLSERRSEFPDPSQVEDMLGEVRRLRRKRLRTARERADQVLRPKPRRIRSGVMRAK
jgi:CHAD domain-containing protein